jgi:hypothetical protein
MRFRFGGRIRMNTENGGERAEQDSGSNAMITQAGIEMMGLPPVTSGQSSEVHVASAKAARCAGQPTHQREDPHRALARVQRVLQIVARHRRERRDAAQPGRAQPLDEPLGRIDAVEHAQRAGRPGDTHD